jgi:hypothetical protein
VTLIDVGIWGAPYRPGGQIPAFAWVTRMTARMMRLWVPQRAANLGFGRLRIALEPGFCVSFILGKSSGKIKPTEPGDFPL